MRWAELSTAVQVTIAAIFALLAVSSVVVIALRVWRPDKDWRELTQRVGTWWVLVGLFSFSLIVSDTLTILFFTGLSLLALNELLSLVPMRPTDRRVLFWAYVAVPIQYLWVCVQWYGMFIAFIPVYMFLILPVRLVAMGKTDGFIRTVGTLHWGLMTTVYCISHAALLVVLRLRDHPQQLIGPGLVLYLVVLTELNDVAQFLWGKSLGRRKVVPSVSPGKTWAGFLGGASTTLLLAVLSGPHLTILNHIQSAVAGLIIGAGGFAGDLCISAMKRDLHIKDSGSFLPGHGGFLDRLDSLTFTAPLFFHFVYWSFLFQTHGANPVG